MLYKIEAANPEDAEAIAKVHVDTWRTTYNGIVPDSYLASLSYAKREAMWFELLTNIRVKSHTLVAKNERDDVIGFSDGGPNRDASLSFDGEINAIYLRKEYQGQGIGKQLFLDSLAQLLKHGFSKAVLWVLEDNPSYKFYQAMGGQVAGEKWDEVGGKNLKEIAVGWSDVRATLQKFRSKDR